MGHFDQSDEIRRGDWLTTSLGNDIQSRSIGSSLDINLSFAQCLAACLKM